MKCLASIIAAKIALTAVFWVAMPLLATSGFLHKLGFPNPDSIGLFLKLLGVAYLSLLVSYVDGFRDARRGMYPRQTVTIGMVSNGGAFVVLSAGAVLDVWGSWGPWAQGYLWLSLLATGLFTAGLVRCGPFEVLKLTDCK